MFIITSTSPYPLPFPRLLHITYFSFGYFFLGFRLHESHPSSSSRYCRTTAVLHDISLHDDTFLSHTRFFFYPHPLRFVPHVLLSTSRNPDVSRIARDKSDGTLNLMGGGGNVRVGKISPSSPRLREYISVVGVRCTHTKVNKNVRVFFLFCFF